MDPQDRLVAQQAEEIAELESLLKADLKNCPTPIRNSCPQKDVQ